MSDRRIVQLTDWLPPEFSSVSQTVLVIAEQEARAGAHVTVVGLNTFDRPVERRACGDGSLETVSIRRRALDRQSWGRRLAWTIVTNCALVRGAWRHLRASEVVRFTSSPPFLIYWLVPLNLILRKRLLYRITDFYPECIIAALNRTNWAVRWFQRMTNALRRRVDAFEVLGEDMRERLLACGVKAERIALRRDGSPVPIGPGTAPAPRPAQFRGRKLILYSGNWGAAHDVDTFFEGYRRHHMEGNGSVVLWLNAIGSGADAIDARLRAAGLPFVRQKLVPLDELAGLLVAPDAHLITLRPEFMGFVLPSKVYGCIASRQPILYVGPAGSDVHRLCAANEQLPYRRIEVGDAEGISAALDALGAGGAMAWQDVREPNDADARRSATLAPENLLCSQGRLAPSEPVAHCS